MEDADWDVLTARIQSGKCTPFLGAGVAAGTLPLGADIAKDWAKHHKFPLRDKHDLAQVSQFLGIRDAMWPKEQMVKRLAEFAPPDFTTPSEPHAALARLPIPVYVTTNYDHFMVEALRAANKEPEQEFCRWNDHPSVQNVKSIFERDPDYEPSVARPLVFHLHGHCDVPESLVLTEDDYLDFLVATSRKRELLPSVVRGAFAGTSLLFIGYSLADWDFRVLHRGLVVKEDAALRRISVTVQLPRKERQAKQARDYLDQYFGRMLAKVYWGTASEFVVDLENRL